MSAMEVCADEDGSLASPIHRSKLSTSPGKKKSELVCNFNTIKMGICNQFWGHAKKFGCQEGDWRSQHTSRNEAPNILRKGWEEAVEVFETSFEAVLKQAENGGDALNI